MFVTDNIIRSARKADLYQFLSDFHGQEFFREGNSLRLRSKPSVSIRKGYSGYFCFSTGEHGNSIDFLTRYFNYSFPDAVMALASIHTDDCCHMLRGSSSDTLSDTGTAALSDAPPAADPPFRRVYAYLVKTRLIPSVTVNRLFHEGLLYQDVPYGNAVFSSKCHDYYEIRGTLTAGKPFHGCRRKTPGAFWSFGDLSPGKKTAYICEAAIDAISLFELLKTQDRPVSAVFCSIGGVANQAAIDSIVSQYDAILAVDNDAAGNQCRLRNVSLPAMIPISKDWNQDWQNFVNTHN